MATDLRQGIIAAANALGISPIDLATAISYETGGTFDPLKRGPTTKWGQHRGLIQFGEPQAEKYGVDWTNPLESQLGADGAVVKYLRDNGVKPGMGLLDVYSTINAGAPGLYDRSDAAAGGAPGTVRDKAEQQMAGHLRKAQALLGDGYTPQVASAPPAPTPLGSMSVPSAPVARASGPIPSAIGTSAASDIPSAVRSVASAGSSDPMSAVFGMMMAGNQQGPQFAPAQVVGPSPEQATALSSLVAALKNRLA